jgi:hypothetical protein
MDFLTANSKKSFFVSILTAQVGCCLAYCFLPPGNVAFPAFFLLYSAQFLAFAISIFLLRSISVGPGWIIGFAIMARILLLYSEPVLENDYWRYLWDGRVLAHGINPYEFKPLASALNHLDVNYRHLIGWKEYGTIYPPFSIGVFALAHLIAPDSLLALKVILVLFDLGTAWLILKWLKALEVPSKWIFLYLFNPLVLKEISNSAHLDSIAVFFTVLASLLLFRSSSMPFDSKKISRTSGAAWGALAFAVASKLYPLCLLPLFLKADRKRWAGFVLFLLVLLAFYSPILSLGYRGWNGTEAFARHWIFNASIYRVFQKGSEMFLGHFPTMQVSFLSGIFKDDLVAKFLSGLTLLGFCVMRASRFTQARDLPKEITYVFAALLLLSPVVNAWYVLWLLPFACIAKSGPWLTFSYLVAASYSWWYSPELAFYFRWGEYACLFLVLVIWIRLRKQRQLAFAGVVKGTWQKRG